ncbi:MAG TPA: hypothetical protein VGD80_09770 [Kofleriaceae bacterium]
MLRLAILALCTTACSRSQSTADQDLPGLVVEARRGEATIDVERATGDPAELGRALGRPYRATLAALGPHSVAVSTVTTVSEAGQPISELSDHAQIDNGDSGAYHAIYTNSADYGRETTFINGKLFLRPRYQRWHARGPEAPDEPEALRDQYFDAVAAVWDLLAPGVELADRGQIQISGRTGRKIEVKRASDPAQPPDEPIAQRKWREQRSIDDVSGEVVIDAEKGVPLVVKLAGSLGFSREGRRFAMKVSVDSTISGLGSAAAIAVPPEGEVVATPERLREVDDRDYLLQGIAPPLRRNPDGTAIPPAPIGPGGTKLVDKPSDKAGSASDAAGKASDKPSGKPPGKASDKPTGKPADSAAGKTTGTTPSSTGKAPDSAAGKTGGTTPSNAPGKAPEGTAGKAAGPSAGSAADAQRKPGDNPARGSNSPDGVRR